MSYEEQLCTLKGIMPAISNLTYLFFNFKVLSIHFNFPYAMNNCVLLTVLWLQFQIYFLTLNVLSISSDCNEWLYYCSFFDKNLMQSHKISKKYLKKRYTKQREHNKNHKKIRQNHGQKRKDGEKKQTTVCKTLHKKLHKHVLRKG